MPQVTVLVTNPDDMRLSVTAEMTVGEWSYITSLVGDRVKVPYYSPLDDFVAAIKKGIIAIKERKDIVYDTKAKGE